jgi:hypothetical protein
MGCGHSPPEDEVADYQGSVQAKLHLRSSELINERFWEWKAKRPDNPSYWDENATSGQY